MLIDTHAHLTSSFYTDNSQIIASMKEDGLSKIITVGCDMSSSRQGKIIASNNQDVYFSAGIHPSDSKKYEPQNYQELLQLSRHEKCVAIGEIGLDYHYPDTDKPSQQALLKDMLKLTKESGLPAILHVRDADSDMLRTVKNNLDCFPNKGVLHCFSGSKETALEYISMGFYISFTGVITFKNAKKFPEIISAIDRAKILLETDCPFLTPDPFRGQKNEPKMVRYVAQKLAEIYSVSYEEICELTTKNAKRLFKKIK